MPTEWWDARPAEADRPARRSARRWRDKFREAMRGMKLGVRGHSSFFVHFFFAALAAVTALALQCDLTEWCLVLGCVGLVITAELFNSAVETMYNGLDAEARARCRACLDVAAGAVLAASTTAALVGTLVFTRRVLMLFHVWEV
ncbi:MAG TPA: diacylglycerol kinase [Gemmata sp.]|nr:diacylglycerol kinase [Gemmata sp.]